MWFPHEIYWYVTGIRAGQRVVFGPCWKDIRPYASKRRYRIVELGDVLCAERYLRDFGCTNVQRRQATSPVNPAVRDPR